MADPAAATPGDPLDRLAPIRFGRAVCGEIDQALRREWWLANGRGGYAAGTVALALTRRYHGLLIAPLDPPLGRFLVFAKADATVIDGSGRHPLFTNLWGGGTVAPPGYVALESFALDGTIPVWRFAWGDRIVEQRIWMEPGADTTYVAWRLDGAAEVGDAPHLEVTLLANCRDHHGETWMPGFNPEIVSSGAVLSVAAAGRPALRIAASGGTIAPQSDWFENFDLPAERERGLPDHDAHRRVGTAALRLVAGEWSGIAASLDPTVSSDLAAALDRRRAHDRAVLAQAAASDALVAAAPGWVQRLVLATDLFIIARPLDGMPDGQSVIAGYPWFGDWGRDTMISLPGLCLATGRHDTARRILETFARFVDGGMLPNVFPEGAARPEYNTVDAALWYIAAWQTYVEASGDDAALRRVFPVLAAIIDGHTRGTRYGIGVDPADGLLRAGEPGVQLTWMDARVGDWVVTPRIGKPVEINALWYNALSAMAILAARIGAADAAYRDAAARVQASFARFVLPQGGGLYDVIDGPGGADAALRPNQIFAVSLPASPLDAETQRAVLAAGGPTLVTSYGLRSLAPGSADYRGVYQGDVVARDGAYHQGPVWAWLLGHWALAHYRVHGDAALAQSWLAPVADHLADAALGQVSEILDGDPPHRPRGAPAQAWSAACVLEAWWRLEHARAGAGRAR